MIDDEGITRAVQRCLEDSTARVVSLSSKSFKGGFADAMTGGDGVRMIEGTAAIAGGKRDFQMVGKTCRNHPMGADPVSWLYWKREALAFNSGILCDLPEGLRAPQCFGVSYPDADTAIIYMEAISNGDADWTMEDYRQAAEALGRFNGPYLSGKPWPEPDWMIPSRVYSWTNGGQSVLNNLAQLRDDSVLSRWLAGDSFDRTCDLWARSDALFAALEALPKCLCHLDAFKRNMMLTNSGAGSTDVVAIDWAFTGPGVVGEELTPMIAVSLQFLEVHIDDAYLLERTVFDGYLAGLKRAGWTGSESEIRLGFAASAALMLGLGAIELFLPGFQDNDLTAAIESAVGTDCDTFIDRLAALQPYLLDLGEEALAAV